MTLPEISALKAKMEFNSTFYSAGILAVTLMGIAIGLICRADVCSVKTKLCRSNKNRARKPEDSVSPFEEIPLNTVNSNGNGKATSEG